MAGWVDRIGASTFLDEIKRDRALRELLDDYLQALFGQIAQAAACNRLHAAEARLSRWPLMTHNRVGANEFAITHDFLTQMLGSRRSTVTVSVEHVRVSGLIRYRPGEVTIIERDGLEAVTCECYRVVRTALDRVIQRASALGGA
jgi:CRP-like cAMP-binding protein